MLDSSVVVKRNIFFYYRGRIKRETKRCKDLFDGDNGVYNFEDRLILSAKEQYDPDIILKA